MPSDDVPRMHDTLRVTDSWAMLPAWLPVPGMGNLPINSFLLKGAEPVLVDTGLGALGEAFMETLESEIDPEDLRWIWLSHMDPDHIGNLARVLGRAPNAQVVTSFLGRGKMECAGLDVSRVHMLEAGAALEAGAHRLVPVRPPYYDAPETIGFFDEKESVFFSADSFGALLPEPVRQIVELPEEVLRDGLVGWSSIDAPWLATIDRHGLGRTLSALERMAPAVVLSGHLPLARDGVSALSQYVAKAYGGGTDSSVDPFAIEHITAAMA